jgi:hypothetical protein
LVAIVTHCSTLFTGYYISLLNTFTIVKYVRNSYYDEYYLCSQ